ncbi:LamG-like jellyroll fold domain-containing protein [Plantactinospora endophytica]|uniref:LamG-like jellyroll fold domain-containing protein n=1 Tax=Plantactinospora endophytica TaxID=673535 RepID=A0ABQ4E1I9_9ACTN|nr:LamG-like jellyroll fold domain-containing protein [Plantactinospora endophytica]GIG88573.1 hypothetical protein Pen02_35090 [Plantactinospora endophytica]
MVLSRGLVASLALLVLVPTGLAVTGPTPTVAAPATPQAPGPDGPQGRGSEAGAPDGTGQGARADGDNGSPAAVARASGRRVEIMAERSETRQVFANPDGTVTAELTVEPVRVRRGTDWVPVDTSLRAGPDGLLSPAASAVSLAFSGGGAAPLVRLADGDRRIELRWPGDLPRPVVDGDTASYPEVLPGVDLRMRATSRGYAQVLVVKTREAARNPRLARLQFGLSSRGVTLAAERSGALTAKDPDGQVVFQAPPPRMWDSPSGGPRLPMPSDPPVEPADGNRSSGARTATAGADGGAARAEHRAQGRVELSRSSLAVIPDPRLLRDPSTNFPLFVDPDFGAGLSGWGEVLEQHPGQSYWGGDGDPVAKVGFSDWEVPTVRYRSYFLFDIAWLRDRNVTVSWAKFNARAVYSASCSPRWVDLYHVGPIGPGLSWNTQPWATYLGGQNVAHGYSAACGPNWVGWDALGGVRSALGGRSPAVAFMLRAGDEGDRIAWKKFETNPNLTITYNQVPTVPTGLSGEHRACAAEPNEAYVYTAAPVLRATGSDPDGHQVKLRFEWWNRGTNTLVGSTTTLGQSSGTPFAVTVPSGAFQDGSKIRWRARALDDRDESPWTGWCDLTVDQVAPDRAPLVSSTDYPEQDLGGGLGRTGTFTFTANGVPDVARYRYWLGNSPPHVVDAANVGGAATARLTPTDWGPTDLYVQSLDRAGNPSPNITNYHFRVGRGTGPVGYWRLDGKGAETSALDGSGHGHHGTVSNSGSTPVGAAWTLGRNADALRFDGTAGHVSTGNGSTVRTDATFTVAAWVRLDDADGNWHTAVSQDGNRGSGFYLQYVPMSRSWAFAMLRSDVDAALADRAVAATPAPVGVWTHLAGVYDVATATMRLYVDGVPVASTTHGTPWHHDGGTVQIGRARHNGAPVDHWTGAVDEVRVFDRLLVDEEIRELASSPANDEGLWPMEEGQGGTAGDVSGNFRTATATGGVTWASGAVGAGSVRLDGTGHLSTAKPALRTDGSFTAAAWVLLDPAGMDGTRAILTQDGNRASGFGLKYRVDSRKWSISVPSGDIDGPSFVRAESADPARPGEWTQLVAVRDVAARQLRLYVNGSIVGTTPFDGGWHATGGLQIGRSKIAGRPAEFFTGQIDNVHVFTGVLTDDQIREEFGNPPTTAYTPFAGQFSRYTNHDGDHLTGIGAVPPGYRVEGSLGFPAAAGAANTRLLYACLLGETDGFTSADPNCEGQRRLGVLGSVYQSPPPDVPSTPIWRCRVGAAGERFDSGDPNCEGATVDGPVLGYARAYAHLVRHQHRDDHAADTGMLPGSYRPEGGLGLVALYAEPNTVRLLRCRSGTDEFLSTQAGCEGATEVKMAGYLWTAAPPGWSARQLHRCRTRAGGELFESLDPACEGQVAVRPLGYVVTTLGE